MITLNLKGNFISELEEIAPFLRTMNNLQDLDLRFNPVQKIPKYRDQLVMMGLKLVNLDDKKVME